MMRDFIVVTKALSDETRVRITKLLEQGELCVCELMEVLQMAQSMVSKHLGILHQQGFLRKRGTWSYYRLSDEAVNIHIPLFREVMRQVLNDDKQVTADRMKLKELRNRQSEGVSCLR